MYVCVLYTYVCARASDSYHIMIMLFKWYVVDMVCC